MKVHQFTRGGGVSWGTEDDSPFCGLTLAICKPSYPLINTKLTTCGLTTKTCFTMNDISSSSSNAFDLRSFIRPENCPTGQVISPDHKKDTSTQDESTHPGGTRWNPTQEQIGILEMFYKGGMRTPNAQQIEQITAKLSKYGKIEGKNVFYWFQNHKARERQKQKRNNLGLTPSPRSTPSSTIINPRGEIIETPYKKCKSLSFECLDEDDKTLELFPLHSEGRSRSS